MSSNIINKFKLTPESDTIEVILGMFVQTMPISEKNITQSGANSNIAATGHKIQDIKKDDFSSGIIEQRIGFMSYF